MCYWALLSASAASATRSSCAITDFGAVAGNRSIDARGNAAALQAALASCECGFLADVYSMA